MRVITLCIALLFPALSLAESDYSIEWSISTPISDVNYDRMILDINQGSQTLAANGMLISGSSATPATGTCIVLSNNNIHCSLSVGNATFTADLLPSLNGTLSEQYIDAAIDADKSLIELVSIK